MSAFPKADVQNVRIGIELNVRLWPKADVRGGVGSRPGRAPLDTKMRKIP